MAKQEKNEFNEPNIIYVGRVSSVDKVTGVVTRISSPPEMVPTWRRNGKREFKLPSGAIQKKGFYHKDAGFLIASYRDEFKRFRKKGE